MDIGGTSTKVGLVDPHGQLQNVESIPTHPPADHFAEKLVALIARLRPGEVTKLGLAIAGFLDENRSCLAYNSNLPWLEQYPLQRILNASLPSVAVELEVDSNASTMAEYRFGSGRGSSRFLCLTAGTGLGVGMTVNGVPLRFAYGCMGDIGHTIVWRDGPSCNCGGRGCAEVLVSANSIAASYKAGSSLRDVIDAAKSGEPQAVLLLQQAGEWLGVAIASMANTFFPDHIAIAGGLSAAGGIVLKPAERIFRELAGEFARSQATFSCASLGAAATLIGAASPFWS